MYLAPINQAGGLYGRILTEVCTHDQGHDSPIQTDFGLVNKMFIIWQKQEQFNLFNVTGYLLANSDEPNLILPKFAGSCLFCAPLDQYIG